jgi:MinD-like ATPase involved in chromosome partitioning or flagellar assembly
MLIAVGSVKGSPGATTFALALAAQWPGSGPRVLAEFDPSGGDLAARFALSLSPGLVSLAAVARAGTLAESGIGRLLRHTQELPGGLPVLVAPPGAEQARAALTALTSSAADGYRTGRRLVGINDPNELVVIDVGRLDPDSPSVALLAAADQLLLLARASADDLAHVAGRVDAIRRWTDRVGLLLVGDGYTDAEVAREVDLPVLARIPVDPAGAATLTGHAPVRPRPFARATLSRAAAQIATMLASDGQSPEQPDRDSIRAPRTQTVDPSEDHATASDATTIPESHPTIRVAP